MYLVEVVLPLPLYQTFSYLSKNFILPGVRIIVPFRNSKLIGIVKECLSITEKDLSSEIEYKEVEEVIDSFPLVSSNLFSFLEWTSNYYLTPIGLTYKIALPPNVFTLPQKRIFITEKGKLALKEGYLPEEFSLIKKKGYSLKQFLKKTKIPLKEIREFVKKEWVIIKPQFPETRILTETFIRFKKNIETLEDSVEKKILEYLESRIEVPEKILKREFDSKKIKRLIEIGALEKVEYPKIRKILISVEIPKQYELTEKQKEVVEGIKKLIETEKFHSILLYGVTGSGKSFIYVEIIKEILKKNKKVLILVPEIALTTYMELLLLNYFKGKIGLLHSGIPSTQRLNEWIRILKGEVDIVIGTRSAIFAPVNNLGLIIVDEEHDPSYKEENLICKYHARDLALIRGKLENIPVILGSATPSIKSFYWAKKGKYSLFMLKERPFVSLPEVNFIENRGFKLISEELKKEIEKVLSEGKSVFLYLNRRGYAPLVSCEECQYIFCCPNCGIPLTYHKEDNLLLCHYCNFEVTSLLICPHCRGFKLKFQKAGTEKVEEEIKNIFPGIKVVRLDRDSVSTERKLMNTLEKIYENEPKIIVGTQMGAHGHNFPEVNLVGVLRAEEGLFIPHYKSSERTFQLLIQAIGRAGRKEEKGKVIFQSAFKNHYAIQYALKQDYEMFFEEEIKLRKMFLFPPFTRLAVIRIEGIKEEKVKEKSMEAKNLLDKLFLDNEIKNNEIEILGPAPCPYRKLKGFYRWHIILKAKKYKVINMVLSEFLKKFKAPGLKVSLDIDPEELL